nr:EOG090X04G3 [Eulimnadia texana]
MAEIERPQLRLILKVGAGASTPEPEVSDREEDSVHSHGSNPEREKHKKKKEKKKKKHKEKNKDKKKHKHHKKTKEKQEGAEEPMQYEVTPLSGVKSPSGLNSSPVLKITTSESGVTSSSNQAVTPHRELRTCVLRQRQERPAMLKLLDCLLASLERKDARQFFAWPVTDSIAPGYSQIITQPMDFSTMRQKIEDSAYKNLQEFIDDFTLMCNNAMTYNQPDTIYYKAAKRLLHAGTRILSPEKVRPLIPTISNFGELSTVQLGFEPLEESFKAFQRRQQQIADGEVQETDCGFSSGAETVTETARDAFINKGPSDKFDCLPDDLTADEILEQVQEAAQLASDRLAAEKPKATVGCLQKKKDAKTSLAILIPSQPAEDPTAEKPVTLGSLLGKLQPGPGTTQLQGFKEDRRNVTKPVKSLYYGPFGSYAPSYDSTFSNLSKEETELVYTTYGDDTGVQYAESILNFVRDCDYTLHMADDLLNLMTHGEHSNVAKIVEEKRKSWQQQLLPTRDQMINFDMLRSLGDLGIDVSFLDTFEAQLKTEDMIVDPHQSRLDETGSLLASLEKTQRERLSQTPPPHLSNVPQPTDMEIQLAEKITEGIASAARHATPGSIASTAGLRKAMGVPLAPDTPATGQEGVVAMDTNEDRDLEKELQELFEGR